MKNNEFYGTGSFKSMRSNVNRYFKESRGITIITDSPYTKANLMFKAMQVQAKKSGKSVRKSTPVITSEDLLKIGNYFDHNYMNLPSPRKLLQTVMFYIIYFFC